jgi:hypothetical protein
VRCWRRRGGFYPRAWRRSRGLLPAAVRLGWRRSGSAVWFPRAQVASGAAAQPLAAGRRACAGGRRRPLGPDLGPLGPIWVGAGRRFCAAVVLPGDGGGATAGFGWWRCSAGVLQCGWQGLCGPVWAWPGHFGPGPPLLPRPVGCRDDTRWRRFPPARLQCCYPLSRCPIFLSLGLVLVTTVRRRG